MITLFRTLKPVAGLFYEIPPESTPAAVEARTVHNADEALEPVKPFALSTWLMMLLLIIVLFGFSGSWVDDALQSKSGGRYHMNNNYASWELGALVWNAVFAMYFYWKVPLTQNRVVEKVTPLLVWIGVGGSTVLASLTLVQEQRSAQPLLPFLPAQHVLYVLLIGVLFLVIDVLHACKQNSPRHKAEFLQCVLLADVPMVPALAVLYCYQCVRGPGELEKLDIFLSGAISFQLIASTLIFACIQAGVFNHVFSRFFRRRDSVLMAQAH